MNRAIKADIERRIALGEFAGGHWFCGCCQHITELDLEHECAKCLICGSPRVRYHEAQPEQPRPPASVVRVRGVEQPKEGLSPVVAHQWFDTMRTVVAHAGS
jgi:hypothetical protein